MKLIHSKDIFYIIRDTLKLLDPKVMNHGVRTSYVLYKMLQIVDKYEMYEVAELCMIATLHDIGAFKTDYQEDQLRYESKDYMPHSIYGYLFLLYLTPFKDRAKILLYHHTDYDKIPKTNYEYEDIIYYLHIAEKVDLYSNALGSKFEYTMFQKQSGTKVAPKALELFYQAENRFGIIAKLRDGSYIEELEELYEYLIFTNEEKRDLILGLMYCVAFQSEYTMTDMVTCSFICEQICDKLLLPKEDQEMLFCAAILHDAGMCVVPRDIIEAPRKLNEEETNIMRSHIMAVYSILKDRLDPKCLDIIMAHHERGDGSGYPNHLKDIDMTRLQRILQVADTITGLTAVRSYREPKPKDVVISILNEEASKGKLNREIVRTVTTFYDTIMEGVREKSVETLSMYHKLQDNYAITYKQIKDKE